MPEVTREELEKLPYYDGQNPHGRVVPLRSYYDADEDDWYWYVSVREGELGRMGGGETTSGAYFAKEPADPSRDVSFPLSTFAARYVSWREVAVVTAKMESSFLQMASLFGKLDLIAEAHSLTDTEKQALLESEIEHLMTMARSFYDLLQKFSKRLASKVVDREDRESRVFRHLPDSFASIALDGNEPRPADEITNRYGLHDELAKFYASEAETFVTFRNIRNGLIHHGKRAPTIFMLDEGPAIDVSGGLGSRLPWSDLPVWEETRLVRDRFGSVEALTADVARRCFGLTTRYGDAFTAQVAVPPALLSDVKVFLRSPFTHYLNALDEIVANPWD